MVWNGTLASLFEVSSNRNSGLHDRQKGDVILVLITICSVIPNCDIYIVKVVCLTVVKIRRFNPKYVFIHLLRNLNFGILWFMTELM